ncbi:MAG: flippase-like domain-containing protein [Chloroflexi bacterium]|nr:flippase-like domain-containing protein [Chloroflexota bacterium]
MISKADLPSQRLPDVFPASDSLSRSEPQSEFPLIRAYQFNRLAQRFLPYLVASLVITFLLQRIHPETFWQLIRQADGKWLLVGFAFYCLTNVLRACRLGVLVPGNNRWQAFRFLPEITLLSFLNNVVPARGGEFSFPYFMARRHGLPVSDGFTYLLITRVFDFVAVIILFQTFLLIRRNSLSPTAQPLIGVIAIFFLFCLLFLATLPWLGQLGLRIMMRLLSYLHLSEGKPGQTVNRLGQKVAQAMTHTHDVSTYLRLLFWSLLVWFSTFAFFAAFMHAVGLPVAYASVIVGSTFATFAKAIPFITVSGVGPHEAGWTIGFRLVGMAFEDALASGLAVNMLTLTASSIAGSVMALYCYIYPTGQNRAKSKVQALTTADIPPLSKR